jgi:chromosome condensin MukBEF MukE localization factor
MMGDILNFLDYKENRLAEEQTAFTFEELCDKLKEVDEISLMEVLEISSEDLVERFEDKIEIKINQIKKDLRGE